MVKWADYAVTRVQYDDDGSRIVAYEVREDLGDALGAASMVAWDAVVQAMLRGVSFVTAVEREGRFYVGATLDIVLKTVEDAAKGDNLNHLPSVV